MELRSLLTREGETVELIQSVCSWGDTLSPPPGSPDVPHNQDVQHRWWSSVSCLWPSAKWHHPCWAACEGTGGELHPGGWGRLPDMHRGPPLDLSGQVLPSRAPRHMPGPLHWDCPSKLEGVKGWSSLDTQKLLAACDGGKVTLPQQMCWLLALTVWGCWGHRAATVGIDAKTDARIDARRPAFAFGMLWMNSCSRISVLTHLKPPFFCVP